MSLFEFMMILLSIIIGLGISELLTGFSLVLRSSRISQLSVAHWSLFLTLFLVLLQYFWESWSLNSLTQWSFPAMVMMLLAPVGLYLVTHLVFPESETTDLSAYYYSKSRLIYTLLALVAVVATLFRTVAFGEALFVVDNLSFVPTIVIILLLALSTNKSLHNALVPACLVVVAADALVINYQII